MFANSLTALALVGASTLVSAQSVGSAHVINACSYDVYLCNVPAAGGGYEQSEQTLSPGQSWSQDWTQLTNGDGWSIKLSQTENLDNILQYEYTWQNDGIIWYDLSCVNGNPWDGNWEITSSTDTCNPKQQAYRYATDDAYGMQSCSGDASITVTLCSGEAADNGTYGNAQSSAAPAYTPPVVQASPAPAASTPVSVAVPTPVSYAFNWNNADVSKSLDPSPVVTPTTFATQYHEVAVASNGAVVDVVETVWVTDIVTAYAKPRARRHEHHHHQHGHA